MSAAYLGGYITALDELSVRLKRKINYLEFEHLFENCRNLAERQSTVWDDHFNFLKTLTNQLQNKNEGLPNTSKPEEGVWEEHSVSQLNFEGESIVLLLPYEDRLHMTYHLPDPHCRDRCDLHRDLAGRVRGVQIDPDHLVVSLD